MPFLNYISTFVVPHYVRLLTINTVYTTAHLSLIIVNLLSYIILNSVKNLYFGLIAYNRLKNNKIMYNFHYKYMMEKLPRFKTLVHRY